MAGETIEITQQDKTATIWMNRPQVHNAFNAELIADLSAAFSFLATDSSVRVVILAGRGPNFSAGADLNWMKQMGAASPEENLSAAQNLSTMFTRLSEMGKPTIARVQGAAVGGGMGLASACDICLATSDASFAATEVRLGLIPAVIAPYVIRAIGPRQAERYFLTAERISAQKAKVIGLAHEVVNEATLEAATAGLARSLVAGSPLAQAEAKLLVREVVSRPPGTLLNDHLAQKIAKLRSSPEAQEGLAAFFEKRPPQWQI